MLYIIGAFVIIYMFVVFIFLRSIHVEKKSLFCIITRMGKIKQKYLFLVIKNYEL